MSESVIFGELTRQLKVDGLLSPTVSNAVENQKVSKDDGSAAALLHIQLVSRIVTQPLAYTSGTEASALASIHQLFERTRLICDGRQDAFLFQTVAWDVLNVYVRPFLSRWHRRAQTGRLRALDDADDFRIELAALQPRLAQFDRLLVGMSGGVAVEAEKEREHEVAVEMDASLPWGVDKSRSGAGDDDSDLDWRARAERGAIEGRRRTFGLEAGRDAASGLALSGGGIRSATFALGVLTVLAERGLLPSFDYLSTVSGGGYAGAFLVNLLSGPSKGSSQIVEPGQARAAVARPFRLRDRESKTIGHVRQNSRYLASGTRGERWLVALAQLCGIATNLIALAAMICILALGFTAARAWLISATATREVAVVLPSATIVLATVAIAIAGLLLAPVLALKPGVRDTVPDRLLLWSFLPGLAVGVWAAAEWLRAAYLSIVASHPVLAVALSLIPLALVCVGVITERVAPRWGVLGRVAARVSAPWFLVAVFVAAIWLLENRPGMWPFAAGGAVAVLAWLWFFLNLNYVGLHRHYRKRLAHAFIVDETQAEGGPAGRRPISGLVTTARAPYPIFNAALNVPASRKPEMRGRLTDFFSFTPDAAGSPVTGYWRMADLETTNPSLDLATVMAISGAAVSPWMGLRTGPDVGFWLSLLNVRLGFWLRKPVPVRDPWRKQFWRGCRSVADRVRPSFGGAPQPAPDKETSGPAPMARTWRPPALAYLIRELGGWIDEGSSFLNLSDGGHVENLGVYELLRRRCKFIVAIDGEQDQGMTFHGMANLQRMAAIDLGVTIDLDLTDLRIDDSGFSRSHFHLCRIFYEDGGVGYLIYIKLSLTGNEGEFLRRFKRDEPDFPHHPTIDQNFSESRFEAYRSLGQHVGEKLFMESIVGQLAGPGAVGLEEWFKALGASLLEPLRPDNGARAV